LSNDKQNKEVLKTNWLIFLEVMSI